ncbi:zf-HC2 domain-containing protein [Streptomyces sp. NPDC002888]|uniref:zf-HC2 domain-containing protein n=1 Tax=Streptomyces sp. NPDC002888 TaxID=3364668 RepID=UPI00369EE78A
MRSQERHHDAGAYALGVLDEVDAFRFEDHLMECPQCAAQVTEFGAATRQLMLYRQATPRVVHPFAGPGPRLLDRLLGEVAARHRARRRRLLYAVAASVVVALAGPALVMLSGAGAGGGDDAVRVTATDEKSGVWAQVTTEDEPWGSQVELKVKDGAGPRNCRLIVIGRDGSERAVTNWMVPRHDARPTTVQGGTDLHTDQILRYEIRSAEGEHLVTLAPR